MIDGRRSPHHSFRWRFAPSPPAACRSRSDPFQRQTVEPAGTTLETPLPTDRPNDLGPRTLVSSPDLGGGAPSQRRSWSMSFRLRRHAPKAGYHLGECAILHSFDEAQDRPRGEMSEPFLAVSGVNHRTPGAEDY